MLDNFLSIFNSRDTFVLFVMHANKVDPLLRAPADRLLEAVGIWVELDRVDIHRVNLDRPLHCADENSGLYAGDDHALRYGPVDEVDAFEVELEDRLALNGHSCPRREFEETGEARDSTAPDHDRARNQDREHSVEIDLAMSNETVDLRERDAEVARDGGEEKVDRGGSVGLNVGAGLLRCEVCGVLQEGWVEGDEDVGIHLKVVYMSEWWKIERLEITLTSNGSEFQEIPGQDRMTSLQALSK